MDELDEFSELSSGLCGTYASLWSAMCQLGKVEVILMSTWTIKRDGCAGAVSFSFGGEQISHYINLTMCESVVKFLMKS